MVQVTEHFVSVKMVKHGVDNNTVAEPKLGHFLYQTKMCADPTLFMVHIIHHSLPLTFILITQETRSLKTF